MIRVALGRRVGRSALRWGLPAPTAATALPRRMCSGASVQPIEDYTPYFSSLARRREPSAIRALQPFLGIPGMISLGGGMPNPETFPFAGITFTVDDGTELNFDAADMQGALQYSSTSGVPALVAELQALQRREHNPPSDRSICVNTGSQEALTRAFAMLLEPTDTLLVEEPTYSGALAYLKPMGCRLVGVPTDGLGLIPAALAEVLGDWDSGPHAGTPRPRVLYTIPTGANPSGGTMSLARRKEVYATAREHGLIILEDDPYWYVYLGAPEDRPPSLLSMDVDGRVLRFDSFSKVLSSGMRLGFATGPPALVSQLELHTQAVNLHPCGLSQVAVAKLLQHWGPAGFDAHVTDVCELYRQQRAAFLASAEAHLTGLAEWHAPEAGMFVWLKLLGVEDSFALIKEDAVAEKVLLVPGAAFTVGGSSGYVRAAFSTASPEDMEEACARLARLLRRRAGEL